MLFTPRTSQLLAQPGHRRKQDLATTTGGEGTCQTLVGSQRSYPCTWMRTSHPHSGLVSLDSWRHRSYWRRSEVAMTLAGADCQPRRPTSPVSQQADRVPRGSASVAPWVVTPRRVFTLLLSSLIPPALGLFALPASFVTYVTTPVPGGRVSESSPWASGGYPLTDGRWVVRTRRARENPFLKSCLNGFMACRF